MTIKKFLSEISLILEKLDIDYIVSGGVAITIWGRPRYTADIDIVIKVLSSDKIYNLIDLLKKEFPGAYADKDSAINAFKRKGEFNVIDSEYGLKADFFFAKNNKYDVSSIKRWVKKKIGDNYIKFISPEDLIISKLIWYRESRSTRQLEDIESIIDVQKKLDKVYINRWIKELGLEKEWQKLKK